MPGLMPGSRLLCPSRSGRGWPGKPGHDGIKATVVEETNDRSAQAWRRARADRRSRDRDRAPDPAAMAQRRHRAKHGDARRSRHRAASSPPMASPSPTRWSAGATRRSCPGIGCCMAVGMFVVEEKSSGKFVGRVGPWFPPGWPGFEVGWGIATEFRGKGYARRGGAGVDRLVVCDFRARPDHPLHRPRECRVTGGGAAARGRHAGEFDLFGHVADIWVTRRESWKG